ncbi:hypothetical protein IWQ60_012635, partial [Tieghemiomyces parasiticus]
RGFPRIPVGTASQRPFGPGRPGHRRRTLAAYPGRRTTRRTCTARSWLLEPVPHLGPRDCPHGIPLRT